MKITPDGHKEIHVAKGEILLTKYANHKICGKGEWEAITTAKNITFNDVWVTYTDKEGKGHYRELNGWFLEVYAYTEPEIKEATPEDKQITIFDILGG